MRWLRNTWVFPAGGILTRVAKYNEWLIHSLSATANYEDDARDRHLPDCVHYDEWRQQGRGRPDRATTKMSFENARGDRRKEEQKILITGVSECTRQDNQPELWHLEVHYPSFPVLFWSLFIRSYMIWRMWTIDRSQDWGSWSRSGLSLFLDF